MASLRGTRLSIFAWMLVLCVSVVILIPGPTCARPPPSMLSRHRRVSDQRLAEIETLMGLENVRGKVVTVPVAFGLLDPDKIGRRRRSATNNRMQTLQRLMQIVANDPDMIDVGNENMLSLPLKSEDAQREFGGDYQLI